MKNNAEKCIFHVDSVKQSCYSKYINKAQGAKGLQMTKATYLFDGIFTLMPEFDERIYFDFHSQEFKKPSFDDSDVDYNAMLNDPALLADIRAYRSHTYVHEHDFD